ncbi:hypothetical protein [Streptomyces sp. DSM 40750]|uniref:hypothetical protein n=1 Tax=Streptomyces sp. DSM 40750 TaxID=2801030 RepID=UPI00214CD218|nr:hypothetical protein [Streptomyces sp. DSM 40750]UUU23753.1 hypothetical protein JIX55_27765 [Streptomyces sp. DSM 40750]
MPSVVPSDDAVDVPPEHVLLVVDMKGYSQIPELHMAPTRARLDHIVSTLFEQSGIGDVSTLENAVKDRGDGAIFVLPARHAARLVDPFLDNLRQALDRHERSRLADEPKLRLRASVHVGPLEPPAHRGDAANDACRLVDSEPAYQAMAAATDHELPLAAVVSDSVFRRAVRAGRTPTLQPRHFLRATARVDGKPEFEETCWVFVPGLVPAVISPYLSNDDTVVPGPGDRTPTAPSATVDAGSDERGASVRMKGRASGKARLIQVGRDYIAGSDRPRPTEPSE